MLSRNLKPERLRLIRRILRLFPVSHQSTDPITVNPLFLYSHYNLLCPNHSLQLLWIYLDEESSFPAVDVYLREIEYRLLGVDRQFLPCPERARTAELVTGMTMPGFRRTQLDALHSENARQLFRGYFTVTVHQNKQRLLRFRLEHDSFYDAVFGDAEDL